MKKNIAMRVAAILFILTMISTCAFSTTFAKYVTSAEGTDKARVAKWGVTVEATNDSLFDVVYATNDTGVSSTISNSVESSNTDKLVAPGTNGGSITIDVDGTPEVAVNILYNAEITLVGWEVDVTDDGEDNPVVYCPIVFTVTIDRGTPTNYSINAGETTAQFAARVVGVITSLNRNVAANQSLTQRVSISWAWAFETGETPEEKAANNVKDTALDELAPAPTIYVELGCTVTQID